MVDIISLALSMIGWISVMDHTLFHLVAFELVNIPAAGILLWLLVRLALVLRDHVALQNTKGDAHW